VQIIDLTQQLSEDWRPGVSTRMRISALTGATQLTVFEQWIAPGLGAPEHRHPVEEIVSVINGKAEISLEDQTKIVTTGQSSRGTARFPQLRTDAPAYAIHACRTDL
jgi:quercetin dioxygenase-like cupin family protein